MTQLADILVSHNGDSGLSLNEIILKLILFSTLNDNAVVQHTYSNLHPHSSHFPLHFSDLNLKPPSFSYSFIDLLHLRSEAHAPGHTKLAAQRHNRSRSRSRSQAPTTKVYIFFFLFLSFRKTFKFLQLLWMRKTLKKMCNCNEDEKNP